MDGVPHSGGEPDAASERSWPARLELAYARREQHTIPTLRRHSGPLRVQRHFVPEPGVCEHVLVHPPGGMVGGDRLAVSLEVGPRAAVRITTPGAAKWYRSAGLGAAQTLHARVAADAALEWLPQEHIVFDGAKARSTTRFELAAGARLIAWEVVALGRLHGAQPFTSGAWRTRLELVRDGRLVLFEAAQLDAADALAASPLGWRGHHVAATLIATPADASLAAARAVPAPDVIAGVSLVDGVLVGRALAHATAGAWAWLTASWAALCPTILGRPALPPRIWKT